MNEIENFLSSQPYSPNTRERYARIISRLIEDIPDLAGLSAQGLLDWLHKDAWGSSQRHLALVASRQFLGWKFGQIHPALLAREKRVRAKKQRALNPAQAFSLLSYFNTSTIKGKRDLAIASLALDTGLRLAEICNLTLDNIDWDNSSLQVIIKGGKWGFAIFSDQTGAFLADYLSQRSDDCKSAFVSCHGGTKLTREGLQSIVKKWGRDLHLKLSPHDFRRTFATMTTRNGAPTRIVQVAGRWQNIDMVVRYTESIEQEAIKPYLPVPALMTVKEKSTL